MDVLKDPLVGLACVIVLGIGVQWLAWRLRLPSVLLLLVFGFLAGPATGVLNPDVLFGKLLLPVVSISVALILFEGALSLQVSELRGTGGVVRNLVTVGALATWLLSAGGACLVLGFTPSTALLLGAILVVTGPTVVGPILRHVRPAGPIGPIAKWEGIVIDPIGAVLAVLVFEATRAAEVAGVGEATRDVLINVLRTAAVGTAAGLVGAVPLIVLLRRYWIPDFLQSPVLLMVVVGVFAVSNVLQHESGLLAVTLLGVILANQRWVRIGHLVEFKENLRVLLISALFIVLSARIQPAELVGLGWWSVAFVVFLMVVVRPAAVWLSTIRSGLSWREKTFLSWLAPRGIVAASFASVFALRLGPSGEKMAAVAFLVIVSTVALYGLSITPLARWLGVATPNPQGLLIAGANRIARAIGAAVQEAGFQVLLVDRDRDTIRTARMEGLPTWYGSILSKQAMDEMELGGIGRLLALTPKEEVNSLAAWHFREVFGRAGVYQLPPAASRGVRTETAPEHLRGRLAFSQEATYAHLQSRFGQGAEIKTTKLTDEFDFEAFQQHYHHSALPLFLVREPGVLTVCTVVDPPEPKPGHTLISLVDPLV